MFHNPILRIPEAGGKTEIAVLRRKGRMKVVTKKRLEARMVVESNGSESVAGKGLRRIFRVHIMAAARAIRGPNIYIVIS